MGMRTARILQLALAILCLPILCAAQETADVKEIKVLKVGSSSFGYELIEQTRAIVETSGDYKLVCDEKGEEFLISSRLLHFVLANLLWVTFLMH